jgi:hypothetical protein
MVVSDFTGRSTWERRRMTRMGLRVASLEDDAAEAARIREIVTAEGP